MYIEKFANNLKSLIGDKTITSVAEAIGISQTTLSRYLNCQRQIGLENLIKIALYFDEDLNYLTGMKD